VGGGGGLEWWAAASVSRTGEVEQGGGDMDRTRSDGGVVKEEQ
jgi:hypothetical protein